MKTVSLKAVLVALVLYGPVAAHAQGVVKGEERGAAQGAAEAGPVGAVVGGVAGAVAGGVNGLLGLDQRPRFHEYVVHEQRPSYVYSDEVRNGVVLPSGGVVYYEVPPEYGVTTYRYAIVNGHTVLVDPRTHTIVQIID